jgi:hypothetical protein
LKQKICSSCGIEKDVGLFNRCKRNNDGFLYSCKSCVSKNRDKNVSKSYYIQNKNKIKEYYESNKVSISKKNKIRREKHPDVFTDIRLRSWYGISKDQYDSMYQSQNGACKICTKKTKLVVDHDHKTGSVRGLLCSKCNQGIGLLKENVTALQNAIEYLNGK